MKRKFMGLAFAATASLIAATAATAGTLDDVKAKGFVQCGVNTSLIGFGFPDEQNNWTGMDVDFCRAVAAAIFGDAQKVKFTPLTAKERFTALQSGEIDILSRNTTWTMSRDTSLGLKFAGVMYYDGQGFMVKSAMSDRFGPQAFRRGRVRADRHDDGTQPRRLFQGEQDGIQGRCLRKGRGSARRL